MKYSTTLKVQDPLNYRPRDPVRRDQPIGLIGCGGISKWHLRAYRRAGYPVVALCDVDRASAEKRRREFRLKADVYDDYHDLLARDDVRVVDVTPHPAQRKPILEAAIAAGKHVLSQKPFVLDLDFGKRLVTAAGRRGLRLAVNQNGRWAPDFAFLRAAVHAGRIGDVTSVHMSMHWDHNWVAGGPFDSVRHLILYDFAIHWFDMLHCLMAPRRAKRVFASFSRAPGQTARPALLGQALIEYPDAQATLVFDGSTRIGREERAVVVGTGGMLRSIARDGRPARIELVTPEGISRPRLRGKWFPDGFHGTMGELLCALEENREPSISARDNLESLALCFAAVQSAETRCPVRPGAARSIRT